MRSPRLVLLLTVALSAALVAPASADAVWHDDLDVARRAATSEGRLLLVDLYAEWCGWCKVIDEKVFASPEFAELATGLALVRLDWDEKGGDAQRLAERFRIESLPTVLVVTPGLAEVGVLRGFSPKDVYLDRLREALAAHRQLEERLARERQSDDPAVLRALADELRRRKDGRAAELYERLLPPAPAAAERELLFLVAESHWLGGALDRAAAALERTVAAAGGKDPGLAQRLDLLRYRIAHDRGQCREAVAALEHFVEEHPWSSLASNARSTLADLRAGAQAPCS